MRPHAEKPHLIAEVLIAAAFDAVDQVIKHRGPYLPLLEALNHLGKASTLLGQDADAADAATMVKP